MISFNWKDGMKTISLAELEAAMEAEDRGETPTLSGFLGSYLDGIAPSLHITPLFIGIMCGVKLLEKAGNHQLTATRKPSENSSANEFSFFAFKAF